MKTIPTQASRYPGDTCRTTDQVIVFGGKRFKFVSTPEGAESRIVHQGPMVPGPHVQAFELASTLAANPEHGTWGEMKRLREAGKVHEVQVGDELSIDGHTFRVAAGVGYRPDYLRLDLVS